MSMKANGKSTKQRQLNTNKDKRQLLRPVAVQSLWTCTEHNQSIYESSIKKKKKTQAKAKNLQFMFCVK